MQKGYRYKIMEIKPYVFSGYCQNQSGFIKIHILILGGRN